jgi:hypothetical protein
MSYQTKYNTEPLFFVSYIGTSNGAYIRAASHQQAKANFARGEGLHSTTYLQSKRISSY